MKDDLSNTMLNPIILFKKNKTSKKIKTMNNINKKSDFITCPICFLFHRRTIPCRTCGETMKKLYELFMIENSKSGTFFFILCFPFIIQQISVSMPSVLKRPEVGDDAGESSQWESWEYCLLELSKQAARGEAENADEQCRNRVEK